MLFLWRFPSTVKAVKAVKAPRDGTEEALAHQAQEGGFGKVTSLVATAATFWILVIVMVRVSFFETVGPDALVMKDC